MGYLKIISFSLSISASPPPRPPLPSLLGVSYLMEGNGERLRWLGLCIWLCAVSNWEAAGPILLLYPFLFFVFILTWTACSHDVVFSHFFQGLVLPFSLSFLLDFFPCSSQSFFFFLNFWVYLFIIYLFMAVLSLRFCARAFSSCGKWGPLFNVVRGPLITAASLVAEHRLQTRRLGNCGSRAQLLCSMWDLPRPGLEPVSPALAGRFSTTAPPGKPSQSFLNLPMDFTFPLLHFSPFTCRLPGRIKPLVDISASSTAYCGLAFQLCLMIKV